MDPYVLPGFAGEAFAASLRAVSVAGERREPGLPRPALARFRPSHLREGGPRSSSSDLRPKA